MDLRKTLTELYEEKARLDRVISSLEQLAATPAAIRPSLHRRGRKFMSPQERRKVSERMRRYWAARKSSQPTEAQTMTAAPAA
jgi:hypothetical protein